MKKMSLHHAFGALALLLGALLGACGGGGSNANAPAPAGVARVDVTDAASTDYAHVYVTVTGVAFHVKPDVGFSDYSSAKTAGWQTTRLATPVTIDLAQLVNGRTSADPTTGASLFSGLTLPVGSYGQIRIFLASSEAALTPSATNLGLTYNNEVQLAGDPTHYPMHIPTPEEGIRLIPETPVTVSPTSNPRLVLDFNLNNDVVEVSPNGTPEFILKARLGYYDMSSVGAVTGFVSSAFGNLSSNRVVVKAEQVKSGAAYRITRRLTLPDKASGAFTLYPLPIFGNNTTATYDILIRGLKLSTAIVKGVTVHKGSTPGSGATSLGTVNMLAGTQFNVQTGTALRPTGAWINFYQAIANDPNPFEVRYRHLDPYTGKFPAGSPEALSLGKVQVASYGAGLPLVFSADTGTPGTYTAVAEMDGLYSRGATVNNITGAANALVNVDFSGSLPAVLPSANPESISVAFDMSFFGTGMGAGMGRSGAPRSDYPNKGQVFVTHGGMIIDAQGALTGDGGISSAMRPNAAAVSLSQSYPGGVGDTVYGLYAIGWNPTLAEGSVRGVDLSAGPQAVKIKMK